MARHSSPRSSGSASGCREPAGAYAPVVALKHCEGKADCAAVCPFDVFTIGPIRQENYETLGWLARLKLTLHGRKVAHVTTPEACKACGLCVAACPEQAVTLVLRQARPGSTRSSASSPT